MVSLVPADGAQATSNCASCSCLARSGQKWVWIGPSAAPLLMRLALPGAVRLARAMSARATVGAVFMAQSPDRGSCRAGPELEDNRGANARFAATLPNAHGLAAPHLRRCSRLSRHSARAG